MQNLFFSCNFIGFQLRYRGRSICYEEKIVNSLGVRSAFISC